MKNKIKTAALTVIVMFISAAVSYFGTLAALDAGLTDWLNQRPSVTNKKIYIIGIDDKTLEQYGAVNTWSREIPAKLVERLNQEEASKPAVIGFDIIYSEEADSSADDYFAAVCKKAGNVVTAVSFSFKEEPERSADGRVTYNPYHVEYEIAPYDSLKAATTQGFVNTQVDADGYVRQAMAYLDYNGMRVNSLASEVYRVYQESQGKEAVLPKTYGRNNRYYFTYSGKPGGYNVVSMADVLDGTIDPRLFSDAIVLVGAYAVGMQDSYTPAITHSSQMYGVEIHANIIEALLEHKTQLPFSAALYALLAGLFCGIFCVTAYRKRVLVSSVLLAVLIAADILFAAVMYRMGYVTPVLYMPVCLLVIYLIRIVTGYVAEIMRRHRVVDVFKQYVAPQVVDKISKDKDFELVLGGENRHIAVLFVDIRGFTTISENLRPEEVVEILNEYLEFATKAIFDNGGTLDKFIGDCAMAVFNAPYELEDYIFRAISTAWDMKSGAAAMTEKLEQRFGRKITFGIGIHCGSAVVGNIGCDFRMDYTAIGDTVNTAARLEENAEPGQILISEAVYEAVQDRIKAVPLGEVSLKGKEKGVFVYQVEWVEK